MILCDGRGDDERRAALYMGRVMPAGYFCSDLLKRSRPIGEPGIAPAHTATMSENKLCER